MSISSRYPITRPSRAVNLNKKKILVPGAKYSRGSIGTYIDKNGLIQTADIGEPRWNYDPVTGEFKGLLIEESKTNYALNSATPTGTVNGVVTGVSGFTLPDGTTGNCTQLYVDQVQANLYALFQGLAGSTQNYFSFWAQNISGFDVTFSYGNPSYTRKAVTLPSDGKWYRLSIDNGTTNSSGQIISAYVDTRPSGSTNPVATPFTVLLWGTQVEIGTFSTSYIPTTTSAVTRAADTFTAPIENFKSGRILFTPESSSSSYSSNIRIKDGSSTPEYTLEFGTVRSTPTISTTFNGIRQATASLTSIPLSTLDNLSISFNYKDDGEIELSTTSSDNDDSHVIKLPANLNKSLPTGYTLDTLEVLGGTNLKELFLWNEELNVDQLSSLSTEFSSIGSVVEETSGFSGEAEYSDYGARPTLDLKFADRKDLVDNTTGQNLVTFSRASTGTYVDANGVIQTDKRINLLSYSEDFSNSSWLKLSLEPVQTDSILSPQNTQTADKIIWSNGATTGGYVAKTSTDRGTATNPIVIYTLTGAGTPQITSALPAGSDYDIINVGNGWYRCWLYDSTADQTLSVYAKAGEFDQIQLQFYIGNRYIYVRDSVATQGDGTSGVYIWGAQLEEGNNLTEYIPTTNTISGSPRFDHDPETGDSLGLLVEEARTNSTPYSNTPNTEYPSSTIYTQKYAGLAPDNKFTATKIVVTATQPNTGLRLTSWSGTTDNTRSIYVKTLTGGTVFFGQGGSGDQFLWDTSTLSYSSDIRHPTGSVEDVGNGWYRLTLGPYISSPETGFPAGPANFFTPRDPGEYLIWGTQREVGLFATSYIPTPATFTSRASTATYYDANGVIQTAAIDVARDDAYFPDENGVMRPAGLLLEAAGTNNAYPSVPTASWGYISITPTYNAGLSPDGTNSAVLFTPTLNSPFNRARQAATIPSGSGIVSFYAKSNGYGWVGVGSALGDPWFYSNASYNLFTGQSRTYLLGSSGYEFISANPVGNGWYRLTFSYTFSGTFYLDHMIIGLTLNPSGDIANGYGSANGTDGMYIWGLQVEPTSNSYPSSYIPTTTAAVTRAADVSTSSTVTRAADVANITGSNFSSWYNQSEGTLFADFIWRKSSAGNYSFPWYIAEDGSNGVYLGNWGATNQRLGVRYNDPTVLYNVDIPNTLEGTQCRTATALKSNDFAATSNGGAIASYTGSLLASNMNTLDIMQASGSYHAIGTISRLTYYPVRLSDTTLQTLTSTTTETWDLVFDSSLASNGTCAIITLGTTTYEVDWGDGTPVETVTATGTYTATHDYFFPTTYTVKINVVSGVFRPVYNITTYADQLVEIRKTPDGWTNTSTSGFGTDLSSAWRGADNLTKIDREINTSNVTNFSNTWGLCSNLTTFPLIDTSSGTNFGYSWSACGLTSFPLINTSNGTSFFAAWDQCGSLANFPLINTSSATDFSFAWRYCSSLTSFPLIDTSSGTNFNSAWLGCSGLTSFPLIDTSSGTNFSNAWRNCSSLTTFPLLDTSNVTNFSGAWLACNSLTSFPLIDTSLGGIFDYAWISCSSLTSFPQIDTSNATSFNQTWSGCTSLTTFPANMFDTTGTFGTNAFQNSFNACALTSQSIGNILSSLDTNGQSNNTLTISGGTNAFSYDWGSDAWNGFSNLVSKGWTISYNDNLFSSSPLDLQFATTKTLDSRITFTRASTATYVDSNGVIQTAAADTARFDHDPDTLESLGLLVEESRTNLIIDSEEFAAPISTWTRSGTSVTSNTTIAPDGTLTADTVSNTPSQSSLIRPSLSLNTSLTYTITLYVKPLTTNKIISFEWQGANTFDLSNPGPGVQTLPNGWYRLTVTKTGVNAGPAIYIGAYGTTSDSVSFAFWGAQCEQGSFPTSYIPTSGSAVTRAADVASITGTNFSSWYNQSEGTTLVSLKNINSFDYSLAPFIAYDGNNNIWDNVNEYGVRYNSSQNTFEAVVRDSSAGFKNLSKFGDFRNSAKAAIAINNSTFSFTANGLSVSTTTLDAPLSVMNSYTITGYNPAAYPRQSSRISRLTYWPKRLPDGALQFITQ